MVLVTVESIAANLDDLSEAPDVTCDVNRTLMCLKGDHISRWRWNEENKYNKHVNRGVVNRQNGIHPTFLISTMLDPRIKFTTGATFEDGSKIRQ